MKIFHCLNHFLPDYIAGTEVYVLALSKEQQKEQHTVRVIIPNYNSDKSEEYCYEGVTIFKYAEPSVADRNLITGQRVADGLKHFAEYIKDEQPDVVHFHEIAGSNGISVAHFEAAKATGAKVIFTMHLATATCRAGTLMLEKKKVCDGLILQDRCARCVLIHKTSSRLKAAVLTSAGMLLLKAGVNSINWQNPVGTALSYPSQIRKLKNDLKRITASCDQIISLTNWYARILFLNGVPAEKITIIPQALISVSIAPAKKFTINKLPLRFIFLGRIDPLKGVRLLAEVIKNFTPGQLQIDIYGNVTDKAFYNQCKKETLHFRHLRWMGKLRMDEVVQTIGMYHALILPSMFSEMSPLVVQEAFAAGVPVIGSNVYGIAEQIQHGFNGLLFQFGNVFSLQQTLQKIVNNPAALNSLARNIQKPGLFKQVSAATLKVYESVL